MKENSRWAEFEQATRGKKIVAYGAGMNANFMLMNKKFEEHIKQLDYFVDINNKFYETKINYEKKEFEIFPISKLDEIDKSNYIVIVTLSDYISVGEMLTRKGINWFAWTLISTDVNFEELFSKINPKESKIVLLNTPDYINLGDQAIAVAEELYLKKNIGDFLELGTHSCHSMNIKKMSEYLKPNDIILIQGGGNIGSLWRVCEEIFRDAIINFPNNPIILFPQSIFYGKTDDDIEYFKKSQQIYNSHKNLTITVRDEISYKFVLESYNCKCMLLPDMVLTLKTENSFDRSGIGVLLRDDKEQALPNDFFEIIKSASEEVGEDLKIITHHKIQCITDRKKIVENKFKEYLGCKLIITDRLHGMIFAAITNTPCIAFNNSYKKVGNLYNSWLKNYPHITVLDKIDTSTLSQMIKDKLNCEVLLLDSEFFNDQFIELTKYINELTEEK